MLEKYKKMGLAAATCMLLGVNSSEAAVILTFQQVGNDVTASWSGSYNLPTSTFTAVRPSLAVLTSTVAVGTTGDSVSEAASSGSAVSSPLLGFPPDLYVGDSFGFTRSTLFFPAGATGEYSPTGTFTFLNRTLSQLGAGSFDNFVAFVGVGNVGGDREIRFNTASIPEPSSIFLIGLGTVALVFRRKTR